jgi:hydrocephalus-inducing protein
VKDAQELQGVAHDIPIKVQGEAYSIEVDLRFPQPELSGIDFGTLRVADSAVKQLGIRNTGKYEVAFKFSIKTASLKELVSVVPEEGKVAAGQEATIQVSAC